MMLTKFPFLKSQKKPYNLNYINAPQKETKKTTMGIEGIDFYWTLQNPFYEQNWFEIYLKGLELLEKNTILIPDFIVCTPDIQSICTAYLYYYTTLKRTNLPRNPPNIHILQYQQLSPNTINKLQTDLNTFIDRCSKQIPSLQVALVFLENKNYFNQKNTYQHFIQNQLFQLFTNKINKRQSTTGMQNSSNLRISVVVNQPFMIQFILNNPRKITYRLSPYIEPLDIFLERYYANIIPNARTIFRLRPLYQLGQDGLGYQIVQIVSNSILNNQMIVNNMNSREAIFIPENKRLAFLNNMGRFTNEEKQVIPKKSNNTSRQIYSSTSPRRSRSTEIPRSTSIPGGKKKIKRKSQKK
jgi:hypothetical protein